MSARDTVAVRCVRGLLDYAATRGANRRRLLRDAHIDDAELENDDSRLPLTKYIALTRAATTACSDPAFSLHFGEAIELEEISMVGMVSGADTLAGGGFAMMNRYSRLDFDVTPAGTDRFQIARDRDALRLIDARPHPNDFPELTECTFARMVATIRRFFTNRNVVLGVHVTHAAPAHRAEYARVFHVPVKFGSNENALLLTLDMWDTPPAQQPRVPDYAANIMTAHAEVLLEKLAQPDSMRQRVESILIPILQTGEVGIDTVARKLGFSRQTLYRRLRAEGVTFERVLDELRHNMAIHYLKEKNVSVSETAYLLGFSDSAAFSHAFRRWTGASPTDKRT